MPSNDHILHEAANHHESARLLQLRLTGFVGREAEQAAIRGLIDQTRVAGGYVLVTGEAGAGKSSLIAQLIVSAGLAQTPHHFIALTPGRAYQLDLLRSVVAQLILKHDLASNYFPADSYPALRLEFGQLLQDLSARGISETIYLDGLDQLQPEVDGTCDLSFLPLHLPPGIVMVLGSRPNKTIDSLALEQGVVYVVPPLSDADAIGRWQQVQPTLEPARLQPLAQAVKGNALLVELAANLMHQASPSEVLPLIDQASTYPLQLFRLSLGRIEHAAPNQWQPLIRPLLAVLVVTQEPLQTAVLAAIVEQPVDAIAEALALMGDWVSTATDQRVALRHLLFHDFLRQHEFTHPELHMWHGRMAQWCGAGLEQIWQDSAKPTEQARRWYARQHSITHLHLAEQWQELWNVIDAGEYGEHKVRFEPSTRLYGLDLDRARESVIAAGQSVEQQLELLPRLWRYSLLRTSLTANADRWDDDVFVILAMLGRVSEALAQIEICSDQARQVELWAKVLPYVKPQLALQLLQRMEHTARSFHDATDRHYSLQDVALAYAKHGMVELGYTIARILRIHRDYTLCCLVKIAIDQANLIQATEIMQQINNAEETEEYIACLLLLINALIEAAELDQALHWLQHAVESVDPLEEESEFCACATIYWRLGYVEKAQALLNDLQALGQKRTLNSFALIALIEAYAAQGDLATVEQLSATTYNDNVFVALAQIYCQHNAIEKATAVATTITSLYCLDQAYASIAGWYSENQHFDRALAYIDLIKTERIQAESYCLLANWYAQNEQFEQMHTILQRLVLLVSVGIDRNDQRAVGALIQIAGVYAHNAWHDQAHMHLNTAIFVTLTFTFRDHRIELCKQIAEVLVQHRYTSLYDQVVQAAFVQDVDQASSKPITTIAQAYANQADFATASRLAKTIQPIRQAIEALQDLAWLAIEHDDLEQARLVLLEAEQVLKASSDVLAQPWLFCGLADTAWRAGLNEMAQMLVDQAEGLASIVRQTARCPLGESIVRSYQIQGRLAAAFSLTRLIDADDWHWAIITQISECYRRAGEFVNAYQTLQLAKTNNELYIMRLYPIAIEALKAGLIDVADRYYAEVMAACAYCEYPIRRIEYFKRLAVAQIKYARTEQLPILLSAIRTADIFEDSLDSYLELCCEIATAYAEQGDAAEFADWLAFVHTIIKTISGERRKMFGYEKLSKTYLAHASDSAVQALLTELEQLVDVSISQGDVYNDQTNLIGLYADYAVRGHPEFFVKAYQASKRILDAGKRAIALNRLAYRYVQVDDREQLQPLLREIQELDADEVDFLYIAESYQRRGDIEFTLTLLAHERRSASKDEILCYVIPSVLQTDDVDRAYQLSLELCGAEELAQALQLIIAYYAERQQLAEIIQIIQRPWRNYTYSYAIWQLGAIIVPLIPHYPWLGTTVLDSVPWVEQQLARFH